jgi:hypothetical protein
MLKGQWGGVSLGEWREIGQKMRVGIEGMCVEIDSIQVIMIIKSKDGKWLNS